jgi:hypothetical protein
MLIISLCPASVILFALSEFDLSLDVAQLKDLYGVDSILLHISLHTT